MYILIQIGLKGCGGWAPFSDQPLPSPASEDD